jgi:hypothetical protein
MNVIAALDGAPGTEVRMTPAEVKGTDPAKLVIRLENRLSCLESLRSRSLSEIDQLTSEATHARDDIARPFPQAGQLASARDRVARLEEKLRETARPQSSAQLSHCDFPVDNPLAGATSAVGQVTPQLRIPIPRAARHVT